MKRTLPFSGFTLAAMVSIAPAAYAQVDIRPVETISSAIKDVNGLALTAKTALEMGQYQKAYSAYQALHLEAPDSVDWLSGLAHTSLALGQYETARTHFMKLPNSIQRVSSLAVINAALGTSEDIEVELNAALEINLTDARLWMALGQFYDQEARHLEAQDAYLRALSNGASPASANNSLGLSLLKSGRFERALEKFNQANALSPDSSMIDNNRRLTLALLKDYEGAVSGIDEDRAAHIYNDAGYLAMQNDNASLAGSLLTKAINISPVHFAPAEANLAALRLKTAAL